MATTHTSTYVVIEFADPYKVCIACGAWVDGVRQWPGTFNPSENEPCGHVGYDSVCPSWGPVDGCRCESLLGSVDHALRPGEAP